jgi:HprK-related kinase A
MISMHSGLVGELSEAAIDQALRGDGFSLEVAGYRCLIRSDAGRLAAPIRQLYAGYRASTSAGDVFHDFRIGISRQGWLSSGRQKVAFDWEGNSPFPEMRVEHAHPLFEWGLNWCVATASGTHAVIHSAVIEKNGLALVLPGDPGSGKSTLCAALVFSGWRLLSDELTIVSQTDGLVQPVPRPISLKNKSIDLIQRRYPQAELTPPVHDTHKGAIAYARAPQASVEATPCPVPVGFVVFPKYREGVTMGYEPLSRASALAELLDNTFNVGLLGTAGFQALARSLQHAQCFAVEYGDLDSILAWIEEVCVPNP